MEWMLKKDILAAMKRVYVYQKENQTRSVIRRSGKTRFIKDTDWERGVFWSCVAAAWKATDDSDYLNGVMDYTLHTGFRAGPNDRFADDHICCQAYLDVYPLINKKEALDPTIKALDLMLNEPKAGREDWWWCDALFMAPASFAGLSQITGEQKYIDYMNCAFWDAVEYLKDEETGLFYRDSRYIPDGKDGELRELNGEKVFWSRGIGWVLAAVARIIERMPEHYPDKDKYIALFTKLAKNIIPYQQEDGFWRTSLLDPGSFPAQESSATALFCYGLAWGIRTGVLDEKTYLPVVEKSWKALQGCIHENGMIGWVQLPAFNPRDVKYEHNIDYGAGVFLLAGTEVARLAK